MSTMIRVVKNKDNPYLMLNKTAINDNKISWKAKGLHAYLLSLPDDWKIYVNELQNHASDGRESTANTIKELIKHGYIIREEIRNELGQFKGYEYQVLENPLDVDSITLSTENGKPVIGKPENGLSENGKPVTTNYLSKQKNKKQKNNNNNKKPVAAVSPQSQEIASKFQQLYNAELEPKLVDNLIKEKGLDIVYKYLDNFHNYISGNVRDIQGYFYDCVMKEYKPAVSKKTTPQYADFDQRDNDYDDDRFYDNLSQRSDNV